MIVDWPAGVPACIMPTSPQGGFRDNRLSFETDSRMPPKERPVTSWTSEVYSLELTPLSIEMFAEFQIWFQTVAAFGVNAFRMLHPITKVPGIWKIVKADPPYQVRKLGRIPQGSDLRRISVTMSVMSLPGGAPDWWGNYRLDDGTLPVMVADFERGRYGHGLQAPFKAGALSQVLGLTRATTALATGADRLLHVSPINGPRIDHAPATGARRGLLIEGAATNLLPRSSDFLASDFAFFGASKPPGMVQGSVAPDGSNDAWSFKLSDMTGTHGFRRVDAGLTGLGPYTASIWARASRAGVVMRFGTANSPTAARQDVTLGVDWQRITFTRPIIDGTDVFLVYSSQALNPGFLAADTIYLWGAGLEAGGAATSHIPTGAAAVSRAADVPTVPAALGLADVRVVTPAGAIDHLNQTLNGAYWPAGLSGIINRIVAYPAGALA